MSVKRGWDDTDGGKQKYSNQYLSQGHQHRCHIHWPGIEWTSKVARYEAGLDVPVFTTNQCQSL